MVHTQKYFGSKENNRRLADLLRLSGFERFKDRLPTFRSKDGVKVIVEPKGKDIAKEKGSFVLEHNQPLEEYPEDHPMFLFLNSVNSPKELSGENFIQEPIDYIKSNQSLSGYSFNPPRMQQLRSPSFVLLLLNFIFNPTEGWNKIRDYFTIQPLDVTENCCIPFPYVGRQPLQHFEQDGRHSLRANEYSA